MSYCSDPECYREAIRNGLCETCRKRRRRGHLRPTNGHRYENPWSRLTEAAIEYSNADSENDTDAEKRRQRLRKAALAWAEWVRNRA